MTAVRFVKVPAIFAALISLSFSLTPETGYLGVSVEAIPEKGGVRVVVVSVGSPAEKSGIVKDDVILAVDGQPISSPEDFRQLLNRVSPGKTMTITLLRNDKQSELRLVLGNKAQAQAAAGSDAQFRQMMRTCEDCVVKTTNALEGEERTAFTNTVALAEACAVRVKTCLHPTCGLSSGFITDNGKYLVTAGHIFQNLARMPDTIYLLLADGRRYEAKPLKWTHDKNSSYGQGTTPDLTVCRIINPKGDKLPSIELAQEVKKGEKILMAGFPKGFGKNRNKALVFERDSTNDVLPILNLGTVDKMADLHVGFLSSYGVAPYPGNSGGPFLNMEGKAVGILTNSNFKQWGWGTRVEIIHKYLDEARAAEKDIPKKEEAPPSGKKKAA